MDGIEIVALRNKPSLKERLAACLSGWWGIELRLYIESMDECLIGRRCAPEWYALTDGEEIVGGAGVIENDFHYRRDLTPNLCALYVEPRYRGRGLAGELLEYICRDMKERGVSVLYLVTDHRGFYERYGWKYYCDTECTDGGVSRIYKKENI